MHMKNESMANKLVYMFFLRAVSDVLNSTQVAFLSMVFPRRLFLKTQTASSRLGGNYITAG